MKFNNDDQYDFSFFESDDSLLNMSLLIILLNLENFLFMMLSILI